MTVDVSKIFLMVIVLGFISGGLIVLSEEKENQLKGENLETLHENDRNEQPTVSISECECDARGRQNVIDYRGDFCVIKSNLEGKPCKLLTGKIINEVPSGNFMETWVRCEENGRRLIECPEVSECECDARGRQNGINCGDDICVIKSNLEGKSCKILTGEIINDIIPGRWVKCEQNGRRLIKCPEGVCTPKDCDACLHDTGSIWHKDINGNPYTCRSAIEKWGWGCDSWGKDLRRCCPVSCKTGPFSRDSCDAFDGNGTCKYPNGAQCDTKVHKSSYSDECLDTDRDTTGTDGRGCNAYKDTDCGTHDRNDFKSNEMCCACGGGIANCWNTEGGYTDSIGRSCNDYVKSSVKCGFFDTNSFDSKQMCCICGGGRFGNCTDIHGNATDANGYGCDAYITNASCKKYDDHDFSSSEMCCKCGGGRFACNTDSECLSSEYCINGQCRTDFIKKYNKVCSGNTIKSYDSFSLAKEECGKEKLCNGIFDVGCEGTRFWTCTGTMELAFITKYKNLTYVNVSITTCSWEKASHDLEIVTPENVENKVNETQSETSWNIARETGKQFDVSEFGILLSFVCLVSVISIVFLILKLKTKETRSLEKLVKHMENTFVVFCILLACYMTTKETLRYFRNEDMSAIRYRNFATSHKDTYPTFSICIEGFIYSYFSDEILFTFPNADLSYGEFKSVLEGDSSRGLDIRNISEDFFDVYSTIDAYRNLFYQITFDTEHASDKMWIDVLRHYNTSLPFYISYQDPRTICFSRKNNIRKKIIRIEDTLILFKNKLDRFFDSNEIKIYIHHPGQLLRAFNAPVFDSHLHALNWRETGITFRISQVSILRKRVDANTPCNAELFDDDLQVRIKVSEEVGCIPMYWKNIMSNNTELEICNTPEEMKLIFNKIKNLTRIFSEYNPPCSEMKSGVTYDTKFVANYAKNYLQIMFKYGERTYQEIVNEREFGLESLWSTAGGFVGIFVGTSLSKVPRLLATTWKYIRKIGN